jgi:hypothetical protein
MPERGWFGVVDVDVLVSGLLNFRDTLREGCRDWEVEALEEILSKAGVVGVLDEGDED